MYKKIQMLELSLKFRKKYDHITENSIDTMSKDL